eukprot:scaffold279270_cov15-Tisochrysis_lutea.AAC.1
MCHNPTSRTLDKCVRSRTLFKCTRSSVLGGFPLKKNHTDCTLKLGVVLECLSRHATLPAARCALIEQCGRKPSGHQLSGQGSSVGNGLLCVTQAK